MSHNYIAHLERQHAELGAFIELLEREQTALAATPVAVDALTDITEAKRSQAATLETMESQRLALVAEYGGDTRQSTSRALAERLGCRELWSAFLERVADARTQNEINGRAIDTRMEFTDSALRFFRRGADQSLYASDGRRNVARRGRIHSGA